MGKVINLEEYRQSNKLEDEYQEFYSHVRKYLKLPTTVPEMIKSFYFTLRYLEGTINAFDVLTLAKRVPEEQIEEMRVMITSELDRIANDLKKY